MPAEALDFTGALDLDPALGSSRGRTALIEAVVRRLTTPTGQLVDFPNYGYDITSLIGTAFSPAAAEQRIRAQVLLEEEVEDCQVTVALNQTTLEIGVTIEDGTGPFDLTISVDSVTSEIIIGV